VKGGACGEDIGHEVIRL